MYSKIKSSNISLVASIALVGAIGFSGCGSSSSSTDTSTKDVTVSGRVIDGYVGGANVTINGATTTTTPDGNWTLSYTPGAHDVISASGGTDSATNQAFEGVLKAPASGGTTINITPLTTLVASLVASGVDVDTAYSTVATGLGISSDELKADPIAMLATDPINASAILTQTLTLQKVAETYGKSVATDNTTFNNVTVAVMSAVAKRLQSGALLNSVMSDSTLASSIATELNSGNPLDSEKLAAASSAAQSIPVLVKSLIGSGIAPSTLGSISQNIETKTALIESGVRYIAFAPTTEAIATAKTTVEAKVTEANSGISSSVSSSSSSSSVSSTTSSSVSSTSSSSSVSSSSSSSTYIPYVPPYVPPVTTTTVSGRAIDGYIAGATVTLPNGATGTTGPDGNWTITFNGSAITGIVSIKDGNDTSTGMPFEGTLEAPITTGTINVTPLTTLVSALVKAGKSATAAFATVATGLGITEDNLKADPIAMLDTNETEASKILQKALTIQKMAETFAKAVSTDATTQKNVMVSVMSAIAKRLDTNETFDSVVTDTNNTLAGYIATDLNSTDALATAKLTAASPSAKNVVNLVKDNNFTKATLGDVSKSLEEQTSAIETNLKTVAEANTTVPTVANIKPVITLDTTPLSVRIGKTITSPTFTIKDVDGNFTKTVTSSDTGIVTVTTNANNTLSITGVAEGNATISIVATDNNNETTTKNVNVTVSKNVAPSLSVASTLQVRVGSTASTTVTATDSDGSIKSTTAVSKNTNIATATLSDGNLTVTGIANGSAIITITTTDNEDANATKDINVSVVANAAPTVTLSPTSLNILKDANATATITAADSDGTIASVDATSSDTAVATVTKATDNTSITVSAKATGTATITVKVTDNDGSFTEANLSVTVSQLNAPTVTLSSPTLTVLKGATGSVTVAATDIEDGNVTASCTAPTNNASVATAVYSAGSIIVTGIAKGSAVITVTATDSNGSFGTQPLTVTVPNSAPVITAIANQSVDYNTSMTTLTITATDADSDTLTYSATGLPTGITLSGNAISGKSTDNSKVHTVKVTVGDGEANATVDFNLTVGAAPVAGLNKLTSFDNILMTTNQGINAQYMNVVPKGNMGGKTLSISTTGTAPANEIGSPSVTFFVVETAGDQSNYIAVTFDPIKYLSTDTLKVQIGTKSASTLVSNITHNVTELVVQ